jgi:Skp family chaperone for outer membrane proteins
MMPARHALLALIGSCVAGAATAQPPSATRAPRPCVLDQAAIVQRSRVALNMGVQFQQVRRQLQSRLDEDRRTLEADARALESLRASLPEAVARARADDIDRRREDLRAREEQINRNLAALDRQLTENVMRLAEPFVRAVEAERGCALLIERGNLLNLRDASLDITPQVIDRMNAALGSMPR